MTTKEKGKQRLYIEEGQELVIGRRVCTWEYVENGVRGGIAINVIEVLKQNFVVVEVDEKENIS